MKCRDGAYALDLVNMAARLNEPFVEKSHAWTIAEQKDALGPCEADLLASDVGAGAALTLAHPGTWRMNARKRSAVSPIGRDPNRCEHSPGKNPGIAANRLPGRRVLERGCIRKQHYGRIFGSVRKHTLGARASEGKLDAAREALLKFGKRLVAGLADVCYRIRFGRPFTARYRRLQPIARLFLNGDVDARVEPPRQRALGLCEADMTCFPTHLAILTAIDATVKELAGQSKAKRV